MPGRNAARRYTPYTAASSSRTESRRVRLPVLTFVRPKEKRSWLSRAARLGAIAS